MKTTKRLKALAEKATPGPWEINWYVCRADHEDVKARSAKKVGDELWRVPKSIGPICIDKNHWAREHLGLDEEDTYLIAAANPTTIKELCELVEVMEEALHMIKQAFKDSMPNAPSGMSDEDFEKSDLAMNVFILYPMFNRVLPIARKALDRVAKFQKGE